VGVVHIGNLELIGNLSFWLKKRLFCVMASRPLCGSGAYTTSYEEISPHQHKKSIKNSAKKID